MKQVGSLQATRPSGCWYLCSLWETVIHHVINCIGWRRCFSLHRLLQKTNQWHEYFHPCYIPVSLQIQFIIYNYIGSFLILMLIIFAFKLHKTSKTCTSTAKRAQILSLWASITPFNMVKPNPLIKSAISKKKPLFSQSICTNNRANRL